LGRLVEALSRDGVRALWQADALRREAIASFELDGDKVNWEDLVVAQIDVALLPHGLRPATTEPLRLIATGQRLVRDGDRPGSKAPDPAGADDPPDAPAADAPDESPTAGTGLDAVLAAVHRSKAEIDAFIRQPDRPPPIDAPFRRPAPRAAPLSADWLAAAWQQLVLDAGPLASSGELAALIEERLQKPGLAGVAAALHGLHRPGLFPEPRTPDYRRATVPAETGRSLTLATAQNKPVGPGRRFARMLAPWLILRACQMKAPGPWLSPALRMDTRGYALAAVDGEDRWSAWLYRMLADGFGRERARLTELAALVAHWETAFTAKRRWAASRRALLLLVDTPAVTTRFLQHRRGITRRAAQMLTRELEQLGIVQHVRHAKGQEWWLADQVHGRG